MKPINLRADVFSAAAKNKVAMGRKRLTQGKTQMKTVTAWKKLQSERVVAK